MNGFIVVDKEKGKTSFDVVREIRRIAGVKKAGHTGTLDPIATGVLPVALGRATGFIDLLPHSDKSYTADFLLGTQTDTCDITGKVLSTAPVECDREKIAACLEGFKGRLLQVPPAFSAIKRNGVRMYQLARRGEQPDIPAREVNVYCVELLSYSPQTFTGRMIAAVSQGTYIRSLIRDLGIALGCGAVMTELRRTSSNGFLISSAHSVEDIRQYAADGALSSIVRPIDSVLYAYPEVSLSAAQSVRFSNGGEIDAVRVQGDVPEGLLRVYSPESVFLGIGERAEDSRCIKVKKVMVDDQ